MGSEPPPGHAGGGNGQGRETPNNDGKEEDRPRRSWASVAAGGGAAKGSHGRIPEEILTKLREQTEDCIIIDPEVLERCRSRWKLTLFGRFLGRSLPLDLLKRTLIRLWSGIDRFVASDMSKGYYLFRFEKEEDMVHALTKGPWTIKGRVLSLIPWRNNFRPSAEAFTAAPVWIQLHNLPQEYWELEALVPVAGYFGKPLRVDETTLDHTRSRYARVCVEIELEKPLKKAVWLGPKEDKVDLRVVYENIPMFCYRCGRIGHRATGCEYKSKEGEGEAAAVGAEGGQARTETEGGQPEMEEQNTTYGPWCTMTRRRRKTVQPQPKCSGEAWFPTGRSRGTKVENGKTEPRESDSTSKEAPLHDNGSWKRSGVAEACTENTGKIKVADYSQTLPKSSNLGRRNSQSMRSVGPNDDRVRSIQIKGKAKVINHSLAQPTRKIEEAAVVQVNQSGTQLPNGQKVHMMAKGKERQEDILGCQKMKDPGTSGQAGTVDLGGSGTSLEPDQECVTINGTAIRLGSGGKRSGRATFTTTWRDTRDGESARFPTGGCNNGVVAAGTKPPTEANGPSEGHSIAVQKLKEVLANPRSGEHEPMEVEVTKEEQWALVCVGNSNGSTATGSTGKMVVETEMDQGRLAAKRGRTA